MAKVYDAHAYLGNNPIWKQYGLPVPFDGPAWVEYMDGSGIDATLVAPPGNGAKEDFKPDLWRIADVVKKYPDRFFGFARVKPRRGKKALDELKMWVEEHGFKAVKMNTLDDNYLLSDRKLVDPVVETATNLGIPVYFHTGQDSWEQCLPDMVADIAADYPENTFIIGHMGFGGVNGWPGASEQLVPAMMRAKNTVTESAGVFNNKYIQDVVDAVGADRVLMGSNGPYQPPELARVLIDKHMHKLTRGQKDAILGGNLARVLGLSKTGSTGPARRAR
ncbi:MAG: amidohydrolase [Dehalococcoidia bacterium]|nr:amidohydrolase [Dehalococcoidia bacterium]